MHKLVFLFFTLILSFKAGHATEIDKIPTLKLPKICCPGAVMDTPMTLLTLHSNSRLFIVSAETKEYRINNINVQNTTGKCRVPSTLDEVLEFMNTPVNKQAYYDWTDGKLTLYVMMALSEGTKSSEQSRHYTITYALEVIKGG